MIKYAEALVVTLILTVQLSFCQSGYPKKIAYKGKEYIAITHKQAKKIQLAIINLQEAKAVNNELTIKDKGATEIIAKMSLLLGNYRQVAKLDSLTVQTYRLRDKQQKEVIAGLNKTIKKIKVKNKVLAVVGAVSFGVLIGILIK